MEYADYPMPQDYPDYCHHTLIAKYFRDYLEHFDLRRRIEFKRTVIHVEPLADGGYSVALDGGEIRYYDAVVVANGHHWSPYLPNPAYPGEFAGEQFHSHYYVDPAGPVNLIGKRVVVVGMGNSAMDIICEISREGVAAKAILSTRRTSWVMPRYLGGKPLGEGSVPPWFPRKLLLQGLRKKVLAAVGEPQDYGLPKPDHPFGSVHSPVSGDFYNSLVRGQISSKPGIQKLMGDKVMFTDGSVEDVDVIIWATGYNIDFPFFDPTFLAAKDNHLPLWRRLALPDRDDLIFVGLFQPLGAVMPLAEMQAKLLAAYFSGRCHLPSAQERRRVIEAEDRANNQHFYASRRHTMEVYAYQYGPQLRSEQRKGAARAARAGFSLPVPGRAQARGLTPTFEKVA